MGTNILLIKRKLNALIRELSDDIKSLDDNSTNATLNEYNIIRSLIGEKEKTIKKLTKIVAELK